MKTKFFVSIKAAFILLAMILVFGGCPYFSDVPIDEGSAKIPPMLAGQWKKSADTGMWVNTYYVVTISDEKHAMLNTHEWSDEDQKYKETPYEITLSNVNGQTFMNLYDDGLGGYYLYKIEFDEASKEITLYEVTEYIRETFSSQAELRKFVTEGMKNSYFFSNDVETLVKM